MGLILLVIVVAIVFFSARFTYRSISRNNRRLREDSENLRTIAEAKRREAEEARNRGANEPLGDLRRPPAAQASDDPS